MTSAPHQIVPTRIDDLLRGDHYHLDADDECYSIREYMPRKGYSYSESNSLISNLKKPVDRRGKPEWQWKVCRLALTAWP